MSPELDKKLYEKYPKIFANRFGDMKTTCMCWGFSCDDGWYNIINSLCSHLQWNTDNNKHPQIVATQVKEKFGGLCFYVESSTEAQHAVISFVESLSHSICEKCGSAENVGRTKGWMKTICKECVDKNPDNYNTWELNS
jgi:hypothetical protein